MKRFVILAMIVLQTIILSQAKVVKMQYSDIGVEIEYDFTNDLVISPNPNDSTLSNLKIKGFSTILGQGLPALPYKNERFEIPNGVSIGAIQIQETLDTLKLKCTPAEVFRADSSVSEDVPESFIAPYDGLWPAETALLKEPGIYRDRQIGRLLVSPVRYDYNNEQIVVDTHLKITIPFVDAPMLCSLDDEELHSVPNDIMSVVAPLNLQEDSEISPASPVYQPPVLQPTLMIITPASFEEQARKLSKWKQRMGYSTYVEVVTNESQLLNPDFTYQLIKNRYDTDKKLEFVLLMGGGDIIRPCEPKHIVTFHGFPNQKVPTDFYFTCLDGKNDVYPDVIIGRLPGHNLEDISIMVDKTIQYEKNPPLNESTYYNTGIHFSEWIDGYGQNGGEMYKEYSNLIWTSEYFRNFMEENNDLNIKRFYYNHSNREPKYYANGQCLMSDVAKYIETTGPKSDNGIYMNDNLNEAINKGAWYMFIRSHGAVNFWTHSFYGANHVKDLTNGEKLPILYSINCESGYFYNPQIKKDLDSNIEYSLCEEFLRKKNGGAVCALGANGLTETHINDMLSACIFQDMYPNLCVDFEIPGGSYGNYEDWNHSFEFGKICHNSLYNTLTVVCDIPDMTDKEEYEFFFYNRDCYNCLGDPTLRIHRSKPIYRDAEQLRKGIDDNDPRYFIDARDNGYTFCYKNAALWGERIFGFEGSYSLIGDGYVPIILEEYKALYPNSEPSIKSVAEEGNKLIIEIDNPSKKTSVAIRDIYGNNLRISDVSTGKYQFNKRNGILIISVEENGEIVDTQKIQCK